MEHILNFYSKARSFIFFMSIQVLILHRVFLRESLPLPLVLPSPQSGMHSPRCKPELRAFLLILRSWKAELGGGGEKLLTSFPTNVSSFGAGGSPVPGAVPHLVLSCPRPHPPTPTPWLILDGDTEHCLHLNHPLLSCVPVKGDLAAIERFSV